VLIYGLFATPLDVSRQMQVFAGILPPGTWAIFNDQLQKVASHDHGALSLAAGIGLLLALWSARLTMSALMTATNIAYEVPERRGYLLQILMSLVLTLGAIVGFLAMLVVGVVIPVMLAVLGTSIWVKAVVTVFRWLLLWIFAVFGLALLHRYAPSRPPGRWRWMSLGSTLTATCWLILSGGFAFYVRTFGSYDATYGALAGVIVLLVWFYLLSFSVILGAELNAAIETRRAARERTPGALHAAG
jgi:membrane protein